MFLAESCRIDGIGIGIERPSTPRMILNNLRDKTLFAFSAAPALLSRELPAAHKI